MDDLPRMAALWYQLPAASRTAKAQSPELEWTNTEYLLWRIEYDIRCLMWSLSATKRNKLAKPRPLSTPGELADARRRRDAALAARDDIDAIIGL